ncbi:hypothetical protein CONPUDRAFT_69727 [Coniophora puteana RWD-64-598 SS2]|uniref:Mid2 domain-containing protein n=1 Tax=Coniophora puteana (strain RWD-64-598) TaxID=741705 RepID=A0A5M3N1E9_CONPW|nr:uncharacterized protein CONPUDRAFT_69727 [Coniophora puteana RWD-64-598 SS2]EIW84701.1 hypothetical protein CONPUDRAFT_69727 [Coniophora puteana RWD-64-598 SS2]
MKQPLKSTIALSGLLTFSLFRGSFGSTQGNVTCASNYTQWYQDIVGENPLTGNISIDQVPSFHLIPGKPGDTCSGEVRKETSTLLTFCNLNDEILFQVDCCCNSISFTLSMLCLNCQYDTLDVPYGTDAAKGTYQIYTNNMTCKPNTNQSLPTNIETATCNNNIRLQNFLYKLFWGEGEWYYEHTREMAQTDASSAGTNTSALYASQGCPASDYYTGATSTVFSTALPTTSGSSRSNALSRVRISAIAVGVAGGALSLAILSGLVIFCRRRRAKEEREKYAYISRMACGANASLNNTPHVDEAAQDHDFGLLSQDIPEPSERSAPPAYNLNWRERDHREELPQMTTRLRDLPNTPDATPSRALVGKL